MYRIVVQGGTHARKFDAAITAFRRAASLLQVLVLELATGGLDYADFVGACVVAVGLQTSVR